MSQLKKFDELGYIYTFQYYLYEQELDYNIIDFMENNNINSFYICFFDVIRDDAHYLITTNLTDNLHELITIRKMSDVNENKIIIQDHQIIIHYDNYKVNISNKMELSEIENLVNITPNEIVTYDSTYYNHWPHGHKSWTLDLKTKTVAHKKYMFHLNGSGGIGSLRILSLATMRSATIYTSDSTSNSTLFKALSFNFLNESTGKFFTDKHNLNKFDFDKLFPYLKLLQSTSGDTLYLRT
jgi:hypothetical protein